MSGRSRRRPSGAMVVAIIALVVALTGTAFAGPIATIARKLINGSSIKKNSIPGNRLKNHTLTGQQINLGKLGTVPVAAVAGNAANLGGSPPGAYFPSSKLLRWSFTMNKGDAPRTIGSLGPMTLTATCAADGVKTNATVTATTSESGLYISLNPANLPGGPSTTLTTGSPGYPIVEQDTAAIQDGNSNALAAFDANGALAVFSDAQTFGVAINTPGADCRFFGYLINDA